MLRGKGDVRWLALDPARHLRLPKEFAASIRKYARQTGLAMWAWNSLHAHLFVIFWLVLRGGTNAGVTRATAHRIWHTIQSDSTQRAMLLSVAQNQPALNKQQLARIVWLIQATNRFSVYRNIAAHTPALFSRYLISIPRADPTSTRETARDRFNEIKHDHFWRLLTGDLNALALYAVHLALSIRPLTSGSPLPHRPQLRSLEQIAQIEAQISRLAQSEAPRLPRASSHPKRKSSRRPS